MDDGDDYYSDDEDSNWYVEDDNGEEPTPSSDSPSVQVIPEESLAIPQEEDLRRVMEMLSVGENQARALLIRHRWDIEGLFAALGERGRDWILADAGVAGQEGRSLASLPVARITCYVCFEDVAPDASTTMDCGHRFCNDCWRQYFVAMIKEGMSRHIKCIEPECKDGCNSDTVMPLLAMTDPEMARRYKLSMVESYVEDNDRVKWCSSTPHCGKAIRVDGGQFPWYEVECTCGQQFCFSCHREPHSPCSCLMWNIWISKCEEEEGSSSWIAKHTKPCPGCKRNIQKDGGCNHVRCLCQQEFCWLCGGATGALHTLHHIDGHRCGRYVEKRKMEVEDAGDGFSHYHNRYMSHMHSLGKERQLRDIVEGKTLDCEKNSSMNRMFDYTRLINSLPKLCRSRRVLACSYAFAYFMFGKEIIPTDLERETKKKLFEDHQQRLEANVETLSKLLEEPVDTYEEKLLLEKKLLVMDLSDLVDKLSINMLEFIEDDLLQGMEQSIAQYTSQGPEKAPAEILPFIIF